MPKILVPISDSRHCDRVVQHLLRECRSRAAVEIHVLNVQPPFRSDVARFVPRRERDLFHREQAQKALQPCRDRLDRAGIPYSVHHEVGDRAHCITRTAERLNCDLILMSTTRKNALTRLVEDSVTNKVLELTTVPVELIAAGEVSRWERYGIPAAIGAVVAVSVAALD